VFRVVEVGLAEDLLLWVRSRPRLVPRVLGEVAGGLTPHQRVLIEKWKRGIAAALGVPIEAIREDVAEKWLINWMRALVKPEYWRAIGLE
jgi:hypothetical protein